MARVKRNQPMAQINIVPYIDVMLVLLVIFMITAPLLSQGVHVDLPKAQARPLSSQQRDPIIVSIDAHGNYYLNIAADPNQQISPDALATKVANELYSSKENGEKRPVFVKGDRSVDYGKVVQAMVLLQGAGAKSVGLITEPDVGARRAAPLPQ